MNPYAKIQSPKTEFSKARTNLLINHPFFGALAMRLRAQETDEIKTMATDGERIAFNPEYMRTLNRYELIGLVAHEVMHVAMKHHERRGNRDSQRWQIACDYAINPVIVDAGLSLPKGYLNCEMYHGKSAEEIYAMLPEGNSGGSGGGQDQAGQGNDQSGGGSSPDQSGGEKGSQPSSDPGAMGEVLDRPKDAPASATGEAWESALSQAARIAEKAGKLPAALKRIVDESINPPLPWEKLLRRYMTSVSRDDFDWMRPNRRFIGQGLYLPGCYSERMDHMVVAIDTSGSIQKDTLNVFISEVNSILQEVDCERVTMLQCNTQLGETRAFQHGEPLTTDHIIGGGGTRFDPVFEWLEEHGRDAECLAYFTDLQVRHIPADPGVPVIWVEPPYDRRWVNNPSYGQRVTIKPRGAA